jgi:hypothetical protein
VWDLEAHADASVLEITSARAWVAFVETFATVDARLVYPDWRSAATRFDGVHLTLAAIAAAQGFSFPTSVGLTAPTYWDVESTLWLRWAFGRTRLSQVVGPDGGWCARHPPVGLPHGAGSTRNPPNPPSRVGLEPTTPSLPCPPGPGTLDQQSG